MLDIELDASELEEVVRRLPEVERLVGRKLRGTMERMLAFLLQKAVAITHSKDLVNSGAYVGSLQTEIRGMGLDLHGRMGPTVTYGEPVERGRGPGRFPPRGPIELWVRRKLGVSGDDEVRAVGFLVARAIATRGTIARFGYGGGKVIETTRKEGEGKVLGMWRGAVTELVKEIEGYLGT